MQNIGGFFDKFRNKALVQVEGLVFIVEVIRKNTGITLEMKDISISAGVIRIQASPLVRNVIFIKKVQILKEINERREYSKVHNIQ